MKRALGPCGIAVLSLLLSMNAEAHIVSVRLGDFFTGAVHPLTDPVDWSLWGSCAVLGALSGRQAARWLVLLVPLALALGCAMAASIPGIPSTGPIEYVPLVLAGGLLASGARLKSGVLLPAVGALMWLRGCANAAGLSVGSDLGLFASGLAAVGYVVVTLLTAALIQGVVEVDAPTWRHIGVRVLGSWLAAAGLMLLALRVIAA